MPDDMPMPPAGEEFDGIPNAYGQAGVIAVAVEVAAETFGDATEGDRGVEIITSMCETFLSPAGVDELIRRLHAARAEAAGDPPPDRWAFLVGEGTLSVHEVLDWAAELNPKRVRTPTPLGADEALMVAVANA